jgi:hypothetical protein
MKIAIRIILYIFIAVLIYALWETIMRPIRYQEEVDRVESKIIEKLELIRDAQLAYKDVKGNYANNWDSLMNVMENGSYEVVKVFGDPDDSTSVYRLETMYIPIKDSLFKNASIDSLPYKPNSSEKFIINASKIERNDVEVPVFEVYDPNPFSRKRREEDDPLKVGSLSEATVNGNWK